MLESLLPSTVYTAHALTVKLFEGDHYFTRREVCCEYYLRPNTIRGRNLFEEIHHVPWHIQCTCLYNDETFSCHQSKLFTWSAMQQTLEIESLLLLTRILHTFHAVMDSSHTPGHVKSFDRW